MKKICKNVAVFAIMAGLLCATSYAKSLRDALGSTKLGEKLSEKVQQNEKLNKVTGGTSSSKGDWIVQMLDGRANKAPYDSITLRSNGKLDAQKPNSVNGIKGKWESSKSTDYLSSGDTITVTIGETTGKGSVRQISSKYVPGDPSTYNSDKPVTEHTVTTYSLNLGTLGTYTYVVKKYTDEK